MDATMRSSNIETTNTIITAETETIQPKASYSHASAYNEKRFKVLETNRLQKQITVDNFLFHKNKQSKGIL